MSEYYESSALQSNSLTSPRSSTDAATVLEANELANKLFSYLKQLSPKQAELIRLRHIQGLRVDEIVLVTGMSRGAARALLRRAHSELSDYLSKDTPTRADQDDELSRLYAKLGNLAKHSDAAKRREYAACLKRLDELERAEAQRMTDIFSSRNRLDVHQFSGAVARADALIERLKGGGRGRGENSS